MVHAKVPPGKLAKAPGRPKKKPGRPKKLKKRPAKLVGLRTEHEQMAAVAILASGGSSVRDMAQMTGLSRATVLRRLGSPERVVAVRKSPTPSPVVLRQKARQKLVKKLHKKRRQSTSSDLVEELAKEGHFVTKRTVARDQRACGARHLTTEKVQKLTETQRETRLKWCRELVAKYPASHAFWQQIVFSDETYRGCSDMDATQWVYPGEARGQRRLTRWDMKVHVWGYVGWGGLRSLHLVEGTVTKDTYLALLKKTVGRRAWKRRRLWQQDNAKPHTANVVKAWLEQNVDCLPNWPPNSPDLSPIENVWGRMWADAMRSYPTSKEQLFDCVSATFNGYSDDYMNNLIESFRRRVLKCIEVNGASISGDY